jgi:two-component system sensor histidine kinase/response regulator
MDGFATTALIRQREAGGRRVPIVALTAHEAASYRDICLKSGMDDLLTKPYTFDQCRALLHRWMDRGAEHPQSAAPPLASVDVSTVAGLRRLRGGAGPDLYTKLVELFRSSSSEAMREIGAALAADDLGRVAAVCHKLCSSAANVGALAFSKDVRELGRLSRQGDAADAQRLHARLAAALPALVNELARLRLAESA